jgi:hypothetical protein
MLGKPFQHLPAKVQAIEIRIGCFNPGDETDAVSIMVESTGVG